jgi:hypothetical protein
MRIAAKSSSSLCPCGRLKRLILLCLPTQSQIIELIEPMTAVDEMAAMLEGAEPDYVLLGFGNCAKD